MLFGLRRARHPVDVWPGYVDALSALLILVIFVLLLFTFAQFLLSDLLSSQETELEVLHARIAELTDLLGLEQEKATGLTQEVSQLSGMISSLTEDKYELTGQVEALARQAASDREQIERQLLTLASLQEDIDALRRLRAELEGQVGTLALSLDANARALGSERDRSKALEARLAQQEELTLLAQRDIEQRDIRIQALAALVGEREEALEEQRRLTSDAQAEVALLSAKIDGLRDQLEEIGRALAVAEEDKKAQEAQIEDLGKRLNVALARRVNRLERYRSEFFGRLRELIGDNPAVRVVGDRFLFQSELLFDSGSAALGAAGREELGKLAVTLREVAAEIPSDIDWILRVDGHTDRVPISNAPFESNWELSTARAVSVVRFLTSQGIPPQRLSAAGFGEFHPIDPADNPGAYRKNRRIEIKLTAR
jgi:chemotaxis protein MotB